MSKKQMVLVVIVVFMLCSLTSLFFSNQKSKRENIKLQEEQSENEKYQEILKEDVVVPSLILTQDKLIMYQSDEINYRAFIEEANDNLEGDLKDKVSYTEIDTSKVGEYSIEYELSDTAGNIAKATLQVIIKEKPHFKND